MNSQSILTLAAFLIGACSKEESPPLTSCRDVQTCELRMFMKAEVAPELKSGRLAQLAESLDAVAGIAPPKYTEWAAFARGGAAAARGDDVEGAKRSCGRCHDLYRKRFRADFGARARVATSQETL